MAVSLLRLPPLDLVKGFVAVGRRMSITQAADDLCITQSALSKQVRSLEDLLGTRLFQRGYRKVTFTAEGERLFRSANASVQQLQEAVHALGTRGRRPVTVTASIGVTSLWLLPRLGEFQRRHPAIDVRVAASNAILDLSAEDIDLAIRYCPASQAPAGARCLFAENVAPVASPSLGLGAKGIAHRLDKCVLLEYENRRRWLTWGDWLGRHGLSTDMARGVLRFNQYDQAIQAAVAGQGVALGRLELIGPMLADGRLEIVASEDEAGGSHYGYWLIQADPQPRREVAHVLDWILAEAQPARRARANPPT